MSKRIEVLIRQLGQATDEAITSTVAEHGITHRQHLVLSTLRDLENLTQTDLVAQTGVDRSTMAELLRRLEKRGLVTRRRRKNDTRAYDVNITKKGLEIMSMLGNAVTESVQALLGPLTQRERDSFIRTLELILGGSNASK